MNSNNRPGQKSTDLARVAVFGCDNISAASIYSLLNGPTEVELLLFGDGADALRRQVSWLCSALPPKGHSKLRIGHYDELAGAKIAVISSGEQQRPGQSDKEHLERNAACVLADTLALRTAGFAGVLIVTTGPAEILARVALDASGLTDRKVIGLSHGSWGGKPEGIREFPVATWCTASCAAKAYMDSCQPDCPYFTETVENYSQFRGSAPAPGGEMASCVMRVCEAVISDEATALPVCVMMQGELDLDDVFLTLPCIIGGAGIKSVLGHLLTAGELEQLRPTADFIKGLYRGLKKSAVATSE
jgi:L-lactate dehydrogenase